MTLVWTSHQTEFLKSNMSYYSNMMGKHQPTTFIKFQPLWDFYLNLRHRNSQKLSNVYVMPRKCWNYVIFCYDVNASIRHLSWSFLFNDLWREIIVYIVDNGGIIDHHCLNFLFIIYIMTFPEATTMRDSINILFYNLLSLHQQKQNLPV
jgi:hypothetical protein